jgi:hypothetical protein
MFFCAVKMQDMTLFSIFTSLSDTELKPEQSINYVVLLQL